MSEDSVKLDALDLVMSVLREHEREIDGIVRELSRLVRFLDKTARRLEEGIESMQHKELLRAHAVEIDQDLLKKAHQLDLDVSKICENALKKMIATTEGDDRG